MVTLEEKRQIYVRLLNDLKGLFTASDLLIENAQRENTRVINENFELRKEIADLKTQLVEAAAKKGKAK